MASRRARLAPRPRRGGEGAHPGDRPSNGKEQIAPKEKLMMARPKIHLLVPLLALGLTLGMTATANARDRDDDHARTSGSSGSIQITFGSSPRWTNVSGTQVRRIHEGDRTDYDMFRYGHDYYAYNNADNHWYMSHRWRGRF